MRVVLLAAAMYALSVCVLALSMLCMPLAAAERRLTALLDRAWLAYWLALAERATRRRRRVRDAR